MLVISIEGGFRGESNKGAWPKRTTVKTKLRVRKSENNDTDKINNFFDIKFDQYPKCAE